MKTPEFLHRPKSIERLGFLLLFILMVVLLPGGIHGANGGDPPRYRASGEFTARGTDDTLIIDGKEYAVDPSVLVVDAEGRPISPADLTLPVRINFEYSYSEISPKIVSRDAYRSRRNTQKATLPVIVYIEVTEKNSPTGRSMQ